ncbi:hypothetical protein MUK42_19239 [Musa troglodytarum]|uniref:DUF668 domain-containing protein n=1 Tax=Musa troglodytarum TaxID=320322 RepID=A0A9E7K399_9LILI|nr:hypothetical protein MUK42_19239 [Musa troglodytarum]
MGGLCSKRSAVDKSPSETTFDSNGLRDNPLPTQSRSKMQGDLARSMAREAKEKRLQQQPFSSSEAGRTPSGNIPATSAEATEPQFLRSLSQKSRLASELTPQNQLKEVAETVMEQLMTLARNTAELYHELHALDRFEQDYRRKYQEEDSATGFQRGDNLQILRQELKSQRKHVKSLKKRSLWSKNLEELTIPQIKAEMEKTLRWLVPIANNTTKSEVNQKPAGQVELIRLETLYHADKEKTEAYILELLVWLHHLVCHSKSNTGGIRSPMKSPVHSPTQNSLIVTSTTIKPNAPSPVLTQEDEEMLRYVIFRKLTPGISKSQEFDMAKRKTSKRYRLSKSNSHSPTSSSTKDLFAVRRQSMLPVIDFDIDKIKALDI